MTFGPEDMRLLQTPHNDPLVVQLKIAMIMVRRVLVNTGSSMDIIMLECFKKLQYSKKDLEAAKTPLVRLEGNPPTRGDEEVASEDWGKEQFKDRGCELPCGRRPRGL